MATTTMTTPGAATSPVTPITRLRLPLPTGITGKSGITPGECAVIGFMHTARRHGTTMRCTGRGGTTGRTTTVRRRVAGASTRHNGTLPGIGSTPHEPGLIMPPPGRIVTRDTTGPRQITDLIISRYGSGDPRPIPRGRGGTMPGRERLTPPPPTPIGRPRYGATPTRSLDTTTDPPLGIPIPGRTERRHGIEQNLRNRSRRNGDTRHRPKPAELPPSTERPPMPPSTRAVDPNGAPLRLEPGGRTPDTVAHRHLPSPSKRGHGTSAGECGAGYRESGWRRDRRGW